jgi:hypothetical protein
LPDCTATGCASFKQWGVNQATTTENAQIAEGTIKKLTTLGYGFVDIGTEKGEHDGPDDAAASYRAGGAYSLGAWGVWLQEQFEYAANV